MSDVASQVNITEAGASVVEYEQPLTERMRTFLRLEFLYHQASFHADANNDWSSRAAVASLLDIIAILSRGDVRSEAMKELERQAESLRRFRTQPAVDHARLGSLLHNVEELRDQLGKSGTGIIQQLRESEFLSAIKHRSAIPGGTCVFDLPDYTHWLSRSYDERRLQLEKWLSGLRPLCDAVAEVLWLTRESARPRRQLASGGMFQQPLERNEMPSLLRVLMPGDADLFPEISGGQHRFTVRFLRWSGADQRARQTDEDVSFLLVLC
jgi:cell division protein ZapD